MDGLPRISVITCSYNQGRFIGRTIESVLQQNYSNLEHIVVDGMSTDETPEVLARYPHLLVTREPDRGQADAINKGFRAAKGDIFCFLNSDDTFQPGALHEVARELRPAEGRHVVMGRCVHIDEEDRPLGFEHPSWFDSHERVLKVWQGNWIPQPATFWSREAWERCGPLDAEEHLVLDYDLMCRFSRLYDFHFIDRVVATYRLHTHSKSCSNSAERIYARAIEVSRSYWGSVWKSKYWRLRLSLAAHQLERKLGRKRRAANCLVRGNAAWATGKPIRSLVYLAASTALAPSAAWRRWLLQRRGKTRSMMRLWDDPNLSPRTRMWRNYTGIHSDRSVGPTLVTQFRSKTRDRLLRLDGKPVFEWIGGTTPPYVDLTIDGKSAGRHEVPTGRSFSIVAPLNGLRPGNHELKVTADRAFVPDDILANGDCRPLAFQFVRAVAVGDAPFSSRDICRAG